MWLKISKECTDILLWDEILDEIAWHQEYLAQDFKHLIIFCLEHQSYFEFLQLVIYPMGYYDVISIEN